MIIQPWVIHQVYGFGERGQQVSHPVMFPVMFIFSSITPGKQRCPCGWQRGGEEKLPQLLAGPECGSYRLPPHSKENPEVTGKPSSPPSIQASVWASPKRKLAVAGWPVGTVSSFTDFP